MMMMMIHFVIVLEFLCGLKRFVKEECVRIGDRIRLSCYLDVIYISKLLFDLGNKIITVTMEYEYVFFIVLKNINFS